MSEHRRLQALKQRLSPEQLQGRARKMKARTEVAHALTIENAKLQGQINLLGNYMMGHIRMSPWARIRWMIVGVSVTPRTGSVMTALVLLGVALLVWLH